MGRGPSPGWKQEITLLSNQIWAKIAEKRPADSGELSALWREAHSIYLETAAANLETWAERLGPDREAVAKIAAESVAVEIVDKATGKLFRRVLPLKYYETGNGVLLSGEAPDGAPSAIAFLSDAALTRLADLFGQGPDAPRCGKTGGHAQGEDV